MDRRSAPSNSSKRVPSVDPLLLLQEQDQMVCSVMPANLLCHRCPWVLARRITALSESECHWQQLAM